MAKRSVYKLLFQVEELLQYGMSMMMMAQLAQLMSTFFRFDMRKTPYVQDMQE